MKMLKSRLYQQRREEEEARLSAIESTTAAPAVPACAVPAPKEGRIVARPLTALLSIVTSPNVEPGPLT